MHRSLRFYPYFHGNKHFPRALASGSSFSIDGERGRARGARGGRPRQKTTGAGRTGCGALAWKYVSGNGKCQHFLTRRRSGRFSRLKALVLRGVPPRALSLARDTLAHPGLKALLRGVPPRAPRLKALLRGVPPRAPRLKALLRGVPPRAPRLKALLRGVPPRAPRRRHECRRPPTSAGRESRRGPGPPSRPVQRAARGAAPGRHRQRALPPHPRMPRSTAPGPEPQTQASSLAANRTPVRPRVRYHHARRRPVRSRRSRPPSRRLRSPAEKQIRHRSATFRQGERQRSG